MNKLLLVSLGFFILGQTACSPTPMGGGETGTGYTPGLVAKGRITGFGSVFVNGIEYDTSATSFSTDGLSASEADMALGMIVSVQGSIDSNGLTGSASSISFADELQGVLSANGLSSGEGSLTIQGQTVMVDGATIYANKTGNASYDVIDALAAGNVIEVSGFNNGQGTVYASRVELKAETLQDGDEISIKGVVSTVNTSMKTFSLGSQLVDYSGALQDLSEAELVAGDGSLYIEVKATADSSTLLATSVKKVGDGEFAIKLAEGSEFELEGVITAISNPGIAINGQTVIMPADFFLTAAALEDKIEVSGVYNADGVLVVDSYASREEGEIRMLAHLENIYVNNRSLVMLGRSMSVDNAVVMEDDKSDPTSGPLRYFGLADLVAESDTYAGDWLELRVRDDKGVYVVTKLKRLDDPVTATVEVKGPVIVDGSNTVTSVAGVSVDCTANTNCTGVYTGGEIIEASGTYTFPVLTVGVEDKLN